ncbi:MAG: hypothetical protein A2457_01935 [Candidatus Yanofskybacteria bacterium RIFOXYC2_FULL_44_13]|nr:MAG: hypothetical protein A2457_01935 [Candidatus Yanofskybacteria bacterium RIFOXYC2_FULL_44_13]
MELTPVVSSAILIAIGLLPSLIWMSFFMREDCHPEPKYLVIKTFLMGIVIAPLAILLQYGFCQMIGSNCLIGASNAGFVLWAALVEELVKFYAIVIIVLKSPEFDEPMDGMIYMITAALGFAAIENILFMFKIIPGGDVFNASSSQALIALETIGLRSLGATILHALSSAIIGYFLAMAWFYQHHKKKLIIMGIVIGTMFHFAFNIFISNQEALAGLGLSLGLLVFMSFLVYMLFNKVRDRHEKAKAARLAMAIGRQPIFLVK